MSAGIVITANIRYLVSQSTNRMLPFRKCPYRHLYTFRRPQLPILASWGHVSQSQAEGDYSTLGLGHLRGRHDMTSREREGPQVEVEGSSIVELSPIVGGALLLSD